MRTTERQAWTHYAREIRKGPTSFDPRWFAALPATPEVRRLAATLPAGSIVEYEGQRYRLPQPPPLPPADLDRLLYGVQYR